jgi:hypothetical protein
MVTLRLPEICKFDVEVEEAEGVADEDMVVEIKPANFGKETALKGRNVSTGLWPFSVVLAVVPGLRSGFRHSGTNREFVTGARPVTRVSV